MSLEQVRSYLTDFGREKDIMEFAVSSATVDLAAVALGVIPAKITKTLAFQNGSGCMLIAISGDAKVDNKKFKNFFGFKAKMLSPEETLIFTGHAVGGVCPFAVSDQIKIYTDISLQRFEDIYPACGSSNSAIRLTCDELFQLSHAECWIDVCKNWSD